MTRLSVRAPAAPPVGGARGLVRFLCTSNPFYVLSAGLFLAGLWISFGDPRQATNTWALMSGLGGYTLLLAVTACLLVRFGQVWDDLRTVLLLVVLMFLATSVTFDEVLVFEPGRGRICYLLGLLFAVVISEVVLRGIRLRLPLLFRVPYHLILALFFLYPLYLREAVDNPHSPALLWRLFGFSSVAGAVFLTLLPAIRQGPEYVRDNGSPWPWPLYPWSLFVFLAIAVMGRSFLLCWSMHILNAREFHEIIFGPYFLVPFGFALAILLLELGLVSRHRTTLWIALALPVVLLLAARFGHRTDSIYQSMLHMFADQLGGDPVYLTLLAMCGFYGYALLRDVSLGLEALSATLVVLAFVGPDSLNTQSFRPPTPLPLLFVAVLQGSVGLWRWQSWRALLGAAALVLALAALFPDLLEASPWRAPLAAHAVLGAILLAGVLFDDTFARLLRMVGPSALFTAALAVLVLPIRMFEPAPGWALDVYPFAAASFLAVYGWLIGSRLSFVFAGLLLLAWLVLAGWRVYALLRIHIKGLDYLVSSLGALGVAIGISLWKARRYARRTGSTQSPA